MELFNFGVAAAALIVSAIAAWYSQRQQRRQTEIEGRSLDVTTYQGASALALELDRVFIEYPMLRPYFYDGVAVPATGSGSGEQETLRNRVLAVAEFAVDTMECIWDHRDTYNDEDRPAWERWICDALSGSPACCELADENPDWYPSLQLLVPEGGWMSTLVPPSAATVPPAL